LITPQQSIDASKLNASSEIKFTGDHHAEVGNGKSLFLQEFVFLRASAPPRELRLSGLMAENKAAIRHTNFSVVLLAKSPRKLIKASQTPPKR
jgi:hypothetical protein